jgi:hypothetical protein
MIIPYSIASLSIAASPPQFIHFLPLLKSLIDMSEKNEARERMNESTNFDDMNDLNFDSR